jgi:4'-phosphopantetheinyl transferase EntD
VFRQAAIEAALAGLFPSGVAVAAVSVATALPALLPEEAPAVAGAVTGRVAEFAAGRAAARRALAALGHPPVAIPAGPGRAPVWPAGLAGSIAHVGGVAVAAVREGRPLGLDLEEDADLEPALWPLICCAGDLAALPEADRGRAVRQVFAAKEAVYKAQYPLTGRLIGFEAVAVRLEGPGFVGLFRQQVGGLPRGHEMRGRIARVHGLILAGVAA